MLAKTFIPIFFFPLFTLHAQVKADDILGNWMSTDNTVSVKVYESNNLYRAKILWFDDSLGNKKPMSSRCDTQNPDEALRTRKIIGMEILEGLKFNAQTLSWENGKIYDASSGRHWDSSITFTKDGTISVRGYWKVKWIGKSMSFRRLNTGTFKKL